MLGNYDGDLKVDVLTSKHYGLAEYEESGNITIYRVNSKQLMKKVDAHSNANSNANTNGNAGLKGQIRSMARKVMWPDFAFSWIFPAYKKAKELIEKEKYDMVFTVSFPFSCHLVGLLLKKEHPNMKWTVDYIDPFSIIKGDENPSNNTFLYKKLNRYVENNVNEKADRIFVLEEAYERFIKYFPNVKQKIKIIPPMLGIDLNKYEKAAPYEFATKGINIVFTGSLYKSIRDPEPFLRLFKEAVSRDSSIYLHIIGDLKDCKDIVEEYMNLLPANLFFYGKVSREKSNSFLKGADILLNISNKSGAQLPGKVVEYVYTGKKIINYSFYEGNSSSKFFFHHAGEQQVFEIVGDEFPIEHLMDFIKENNPIQKINMEKHLPKSIAKTYFEV